LNDKDCASPEKGHSSWSKRFSKYFKRFRESIGGAPLYRLRGGLVAMACGRAGPSVGGFGSGRLAAAAAPGLMALATG